MKKEELKDLLKSGLHAGQIAKSCKKNNIRLSVFGWSEYAVLNGVLVLHYNYSGEEYTDVIASVDEITFFDDENVSSFEYPQEITVDMIKALRAL